MPSVSVVIPTYNRADLLPETLDSVLSQTHQPSEVIVVNDGSTDHTEQVLKAYRSNGKVRVINKLNGGSATARNAGLRGATGDFIAFLDSDDLWLPTKLEQQIGVLTHTKYKWVFSDAEWFHMKNAGSLGLSSKLGVPPRKGYIAHRLILGNFIPSPSPLIRRSVFSELGGFDETCKTGEDWEMWLRIAAKYPIEYIPAPLVRYRMHTQSKTNIMTNDPFIGHNGRMLVISRAVAATPEVYSVDEKRAISVELVKMGRILASQSRQREACRILTKAIRVDPTNVNALCFRIAASLNTNSYVQLKRAYNCLQSKVPRTIP